MTQHLRVGHLIDLNRFQEAHDLARQSLSQCPDDPWMYYQLALTLNGLRRPREAIKANDHAIALDPTIPDCFWLRGRYEAAQGRFRKAEAAHETSLQLAPNSSLLKGGYIESILDEPIDSRFTGRAARLARARQLAYSMLESEPDNEQSHLMNARVHLAHNKVSEAQRAAHAALRIDPEAALGHRLLGQIHELDGDFANAADSYVASGKLDPTSPESREHLRNLGSSIPALIAIALTTIFYSWAKESGWAESANVADLLPLLLVVVIGGAVLRKRWKVDSRLSPETKRIYEANKTLR